jgi:hypothetical protein
MLLGKLSPVATKTYQITAFQTETVTGEYMSAKADRFVIGGGEVEFEVRFGNLVLKEDGTPDHFDIIMRDYVKLTNEELATWGTDDSVALDLIAAKLGTTITDKITVDLHHHY